MLAGARDEIDLAEDVVGAELRTTLGEMRINRLGHRPRLHNHRFDVQEWCNLPIKNLKTASLGALADGLQAI